MVPAVSLVMVKVAPDVALVPNWLCCAALYRPQLSWTIQPGGCLGS